MFVLHKSIDILQYKPHQVDELEVNPSNPFTQFPTTHPWGGGEIWGLMEFSLGYDSIERLSSVQEIHDKIAAISQTTFSNAFSWMKIY